MVGLQGMWIITAPIRLIAVSIVTKTPVMEAQTPPRARFPRLRRGLARTHQAPPPPAQPPQVLRAPRAHVKRPEALNSDLLQRLDALHHNSGEGLCHLFGCVLAAVVAGVPAAKIDSVAVTYILSRVAYAAAYLASSKKRPWLGIVRSTAFGVGFLKLAGLLAAAAQARKGAA